MRLLVIGTNGLLGSNVVSTATIQNYKTCGTYHSTKPSFDVPLYKLDICDTDRFSTLLESICPDTVLNCAAMTDVDSCEDNPERAYSVNARAPGMLARMCDNQGITFAHVSTDYIFDGEADIPYVESAESNPIQVYGKSKLAGEQAVCKAHSAPLIVRLSFVYGVHGSSGTLTGFPVWVRNRLREEVTTSLFTDQHVTPSRAGQVATVLLDLLRGGVTGTFHVASRSCVTPYAFGDEIRNRLGLPESLLESGRKSDINRPAARPENTCLDVGRIEAERGREQPTLSEDLNRLAEYLS